MSRILAEFLPSGVVKCMYTVRYLQIDYWTFEYFMDYIEVGLECLVALMTVFFLLQELVEIAVRRLNYLKNFWNWIEISIIVLLATTCYLKIKDTLKMKELLADPISITSAKLQNLSFWVDQETNLLGVVTLLLWLKLLKYGKGTKRLLHISLALESAGPDLLNFSVLFATCLVGFSFGAVILFSNEMVECSTFLGAMGYLMNAIFGSFSSTDLYNANRVVGVPFIYLWLMISNSLLLNFCIAILSHHYSAAFGPQAVLPIGGGGNFDLDFDDKGAYQDIDPLSMQGDLGRRSTTDIYKNDYAEEPFQPTLQKKLAWEDQESRPAQNTHWQQLQLLEDIKLSLKKVTEAQELTANKVDLILKKLEKFEGSEFRPSIPGQVSDADGFFHDEQTGAGTSDRNAYAKDSARAKARIGGAAGKSLAPDKDV
mmetsp:Transcript_63726/g.170746  ORF Transcript_63726/g.170746 Transcript_63726/m.170746 type:complete len:427 (+) Transcript_63726:723-2003(+)